MTARRGFSGLAGLVVLLVLCAALSLFIGSKGLSPSDVFRVLFHHDGSEADVIVNGQRLQRTVLAVVVGVALAVAGALMQALTRNPLADPGLLGVNAGAAVAVVVGIGAFSASTPVQYLPFAFVGAAVASVAVYILGSAGRSAATPVRLALAGTAITFALGAVLQALLTLSPTTFDAYRYWMTGTLSGRGTDVLLITAPWVIVGLVVAVLLGGSLNMMALGDEAGQALGVSLGRTRLVSGVLVALLAGAATAAVGPVSFVGLAVPHLARSITGPDNRWLMAYAGVLGPLVTLLADIVGRVVARPGEVGVGIVASVLGAPFFLVLVRRRKPVSL
ncbi:iron complex transport system permease protein [Nakamurella panacisegetis]|uniref:Iron complex transport system permease protein n=1 Tax=Nakamurella panacisegetis TaxID=1090615 RepID=A0A1H0R286_9ACTN|nr:iron ABC transporter permease [Nakamurella panacisegetis]SDP23249.1 iron complex transport system permease protein [Nakamurella panacisegetis]